MVDRRLIFLALCGPIALVLFFFALWPIGHFVPLPPPLLPPAQVAAMYKGNATGIEVAAVIQMFSVGFIMAFYAGISTQLRRIERDGPFWSYVQLSCATIINFPLLFVALIWATAAYRADRAPELVQMLNDLAFIFLVAPAPPFIMQQVATTCAILGDRSPRPLYPRWLGYATLLCGILAVTGSFVGLFKQGPFAWSNGIIAFWMPAVVFSIWAMMMTTMMIKVARQNPISAG